jgi:hypothetical protein
MQVDATMQDDAGKNGSSSAHQNDTGTFFTHTNDALACSFADTFHFSSSRTPQLAVVEQAFSRAFGEDEDEVMQDSSVEQPITGPCYSAASGCTSSSSYSSSKAEHTGERGDREPERQNHQNREARNLANYLQPGAQSVPTSTKVR